MVGLWAAAALVAVALSIAVPVGGLLRVMAFFGATGAAWLVVRGYQRRHRLRVREVGGVIARLGTLAMSKRPGVSLAPAVASLPAPEGCTLEWLEDFAEDRDAELGQRLVWLLEARAALRSILDGVDAPVFATDESGQIRLVNRAGERLFGRRAGRLAGLTLEELFTSGQMLDLHERAQTGDAVRAQVTTSIDGNARVYEVAATPVRMDIADLPASSPQRAGAVLTLREVTEEAQTAKLRTDFVANASHELRTPIAAIRGAIETMMGAAADDTAMRERLAQMIESNVTRLEEMTTDLLDLAQLENEDERPPRKPVRMTELAEQLDSIFHSVCETRRLTIRFDLDPKLEHLRTDARLLMLILRNLIDNATKHAFEDTEVIVKARAIPVGQLEIERVGETGIDLTEDPEAAKLIGAIFTVADRGQGIPLKHQHRVFERFYQVDPSRVRTGARRGTGLGLAIVRHAVRRLGGEITVESVYQEGTTMRVEIPRCVDESGATTRGVVMDQPDQ